ncbi:hypothetical protein Godav_023531 [Gossypium davidsonii]|uniref:Uncharacterized protein n=1 Tax=Gossypium davidsonii TaxID=34287 RepID=A0A7J8SSW5_GOSDV|nr:hypothetical protein [Gossypium davidsonii]
MELIVPAISSPSDNTEVQERYNIDLPIKTMIFVANLVEEFLSIQGVTEQNKEKPAAYATVVTVRGVEVPLFPSDICEFYDIPFYEKDFIDGVDLDRLQNINVEDVIKYLTQGREFERLNRLRSLNYPPDMFSLTPTHHKGDDEGANSEEQDVAQEYLGTEDKYKVIF